MIKAAGKEGKLLHLAAVCLVAVLIAAPTAMASRTLPRALTPQLEAPAPNLDALRIEAANSRPSYRLFGDLRLPERPLELVEARKTATGVKHLDLGFNILQTGGLAQECGGPSFQGLWTDPVTGMSYARNRWLDTRNGVWLSEDPKGRVDSANLYAFVGWQPHTATDPFGTCTVLGGVALVTTSPIPCSEVAHNALLDLAWAIPEIVPQFHRSRQRMDEALTGFGRGWYNGAVALGDAAQQTAIRYATDPNAIVEASIAIQEAPIRALAGGAVAMAALSQADSDLVVLYLSEAAAGEFREALERDAEAWGELTAKGSPTVVMALGGELLWASKAAGRSAQLIDAGEDLSKWLARQESTAVAKQSSAILKRDFETLAPHRGFWADYTRNETLRPGTIIDRYGGRGGSFVSPEGTPFSQRGLPPENALFQYQRYEVLKPLDVKAGIAGYSFGGGGGVQYELPGSIQDLIDAKVLRAVQGP